jgi:pilus assembly protein FimV
LRTLKLVLLSVIFFLSSNIAHPLGVGDISVNSALNEPLDAEIGLFSLRPGEIDNLRVTLATPAEFARAGIDRPLVLSYLQFKLVQRQNGSAVIKVTSKNPIKEPFLDFLVEVNWSSGRILREYTLLLDPPVFAQRKAAPVQAPKAVIAPAPTRAKTVQPAPTVSRATGDDLFPRIDIGADAAAPRTASTRTEVVSDTYRTTATSTLWSVAEDLRPADVTTQQMMMALLRTNPDAFTHNNINGLKSGQVLRIPDHDTLLALSQREALRVVREQHAAWREARSELVSAPTAKGTAETSSTTTTTAPATSTRPGVKLITPEAGDSSAVAGGTGKDLDALRQELALVNEQLASKTQENTDIQARLQELQEQIQTMERLIALKNKSLEDLQAKLGDETVPATPVTPVPAVKPVEPATKATPPVAAVTDGKPVNPYVLKDIPAPKPAPVRPAPKPAAKPPVAAAPAEKGLLDTVFGLLKDPMTLALLGGVFIALLALAWVVMRRRRVESMGFPESILTERAASSTVTETREAGEESSLLSDFSSTSMGSSLEEAGEVDPLAEADVYLAYNKYQQAEELLQGAIQDEPERLDLKVKLLEVYSSARNAEAFAQLAEEVHSKLDDTNTALWDKVAPMGRELCPGNPLFGSDAGESVLEIAEVGEEIPVETGAEEDIEFDLGDLSLDTAEAAAEEPAAEAVPTEEALESSAEPAEDLELDMEDLESFDLDTGTSAGTVSEGISDEPGELEPEFDSFEEPSAETVEEAGSETEEEEALDFGDIDLDALDAEISGIEQAAAAEPEDVTESEAADLQMAEEEGGDIGMDEVATKLDLAKAYIDMGDPDGARGILDEVLNEGNEGQKQEAQELLQQL